MENNPRYNGKPLLKLLEFYVLWVIGELPEEVDNSLKPMAPKLHALDGGDGQWQGAIAASVHLSEEIPAEIRKLWARNLEIARENNVTLSPQKFSEMFVDENFGI